MIDRAAYDRDGFLHVPAVFDASAVDALRGIRTARITGTKAGSTC